LNFPNREDHSPIVELISKAAQNYLDGLDTRPVRSPRANQNARAFDAPLPESGIGALDALNILIDKGMEATVATAGPRCFHFVIGGTTPAALGADWLATALDQMPYAWVVSPLAVQLELVSLAWLKQLFELPTEMAGIITTGATMANFVGLAAARQWWGERHGVDVSYQGLGGLPQMPVFCSGHVHASSVKSLSMLGVGRSAVQNCIKDLAGNFDLEGLEEALGKLNGKPAVLIGTAGEPNAGAFDPIEKLADLAEKYNCWLHVDGAFGLFARLAPSTAHLVAGVERAQSVTVDGHKWLNVPYDCGFAFVREQQFLAKTFTYTAEYLPKPSDPEPVMGAIGPESSRRARSFAVWATLSAYGRQGYKALVEGHLALAQLMAQLVRSATDLELLADVPLNVVCFRFNPGGLHEEQLNRLNEMLGKAILADGRVYVGTTRYKNQTALRPAIVNWRTSDKDIEFFIDVVRELAAGLHVE
jgi:glutamate/tyrosine decarboxylase-like PLP-dependent enzyme